MKIGYKIISYILLFLFALNFVNMESRLILILFATIILFNNKERICFNKNGTVLLTFSTLFYGFSAFYHPEMVTYYILPYLIGPFIAYCIGYAMTSWNDKDIHIQVKKLIYIIVLGRFCHGFLNIIASNGYENIVRNGQDFWTKSVIAATGQGALMTMAISMLFYTIFYINNKKILEKSVFLIAILISIYNSLMSASRTALIITAIVFSCCVLYTVFLSNLSFKKKFCIISGIIIGAVIVVFTFEKDLFHLKTIWEQSPLHNRVSTVSGYETGDAARKDMIISAIEIGINHPFGDGTLDTAHNFWLDILKQTGWFPFMLILIYTVNIIKDMIQILKSNNVTPQNKYLIFSIVSGILINFSVEPIMKGMPYYFSVFCIIAGILNKYLYVVKRKKENVVNE